MPRTSAHIVRISLLYLGTGATLGLLMLLDRACELAPWVWMLRPLHSEALLVGWFFQLAFGVAFWILPRKGTDDRSGRIIPAIVLLNAGLVLAATGSVSGSAPMHLAGRLLELAGVVTFASSIWPRVRALKAHPH